MKAVLTIAGSDSCGGAGIQADIKTMLANGVYGMSAITALTAQNTVGVRDVLEVNPDFLGQQLDAVFEDIYPDAVKIGMVSNAELVKCIVRKLQQYQAKKIVVDPVMVSTSGASLMQENTRAVMESQLFPLATVITPNIPEAQLLSGSKIVSKEDMERVAGMLGEKYGCSVLVKGGHAVSDADDVLFAAGELHWFPGERIENPNTHGTGCTLSSAIASYLAKGESLRSAISESKKYISGALRAGLDFGAGSGPLHHGYQIEDVNLTRGVDEKKI